MAIAKRGGEKPAGKKTGRTRAETGGSMPAASPPAEAAPSSPAGVAALPAVPPADLLLAKECHIRSLEGTVTSRDERINALEHQIGLLMTSRSWRVTAPLRGVRVAVAASMRFVRGLPRRLYSALPMGARTRARIRHALFSWFGPVFSHTAAYRRWVEYHKVSETWQDAPAAMPNTAPAPASPASLPALPVADGVWEWADYAHVSARIREAKQARREKLAPVPLEMIDIAGESFAAAAKRIKLPAVSGQPDVSIILPVFNHLKLTLECLLSITRDRTKASYEIILADDASSDETAAIVSGIRNLRVVRNEANLGFLRNCNRALGEVRGKHVLYLNNDVQVQAGWLDALMETLAAHPDAGAVGPKFVYPNGYLQEAGAAFRADGTADMLGLNDDPALERYNYVRRVDYVSGACLLMTADLARKLGGFSEEFLPCYCEDSDLCLRIRAEGHHIYYTPRAVVVHHLSKTTAGIDSGFKLQSIAANKVKLQKKWQEEFDRGAMPRVITFYLPQFHPFPENDRWWGTGFTEWTNVTKARPNFVGHYQPRLPADLGFYDLRLLEVMQQQAEMAKRYGVHGFCYYYYWFDGKRLLDRPLEQMLAAGAPDMPFCLCWANENWTRRWDGQEHEVLMAQAHSPADDEAVIGDLIRYFRDGRYIRIDGKPLLLIYRVTLFPDFATTAERWRRICREQGVGEIYLASVESFELVQAGKKPADFGCDAAVEFPPHGMADQTPPSGEVTNPDFDGSVADYRDIAVKYAVRDFPAYTRFKGVAPGWDNTARRQNNGFCFETSTPGAFQAWMEETLDQTRQQHSGDERLVFVNAWNEWAEGTYLEPDRRFGHSYLEALRNAFEAPMLLNRNKYWHGN